MHVRDMRERAITNQECYKIMNRIYSSSEFDNFRQYIRHIRRLEKIHGVGRKYQTKIPSSARGGAGPMMAALPKRESQEV